MKKINFLIILTFILNTIQLSAQNNYGIKYGIKVGINAANSTFNVDSKFGDEPPTTNKLGLRLGVTLEAPISDGTLNWQTGVFFNSKGYSLDIEELFEDEGLTIHDYEGYARISYNYIEIPFNLTYKNGDMQLFAGPYIGLGIGGKFSHDFSFESNGLEFDSDDVLESKSDVQPVFGEIDSDEYQEHLNDDDLSELYRGFDYGINLGIGYQANNVLFNLEYSIGLGNLTPDYAAISWGIDENFTNGYVQKNRLINFSISYFFNQEPKEPEVRD